MFYLLAGTSLCENTWYSQVYWADTLYISAKRWCTSTILLAVDTPKCHFCHTYHGSRCICFSASNDSYGYLQRRRQRLTRQLHMQCLSFIIEDHCYDDLNVKHSKNCYEQDISALKASISSWTTWTVDKIWLLGKQTFSRDVKHPHERVAGTMSLVQMLHPVQWRYLASRKWYKLLYPDPSNKSQPVHLCWSLY